MKRIWNGLVKAYLASGIIFGIATFALLHSGRPLPSVARCWEQVAQYGGVAAASQMPNLVLFSAYRGLLWPVSLARSVGVDAIPFGNWLLMRYDPFPDVCR